MVNFLSLTNLTHLFGGIKLKRTHKTKSIYRTKIMELVRHDKLFVKFIIRKIKKKFVLNLNFYCEQRYLKEKSNKIRTGNYYSVADPGCFIPHQQIRVQTIFIPGFRISDPT
jgi:hypothetical protein